MNKKEFLETLIKKLSILNEQEKQDIISEYTDTINEKIKHGQTEEEAVKDFGDIDNLVKEILTAYKINPDFDDKEESLASKGEKVIKNLSEKIADGTNNLINGFKSSNQEINLQLVFEIIIKVFILLIGLLVIRGVFGLFHELGDSIFDGFFEPLSTILTTVWSIFLFALYICLLVMIVIAMFKQYFYSNKSEGGIKMENNSEESKENNKASNEETINASKNDEVKKNFNNANIKPPKQKRGTTAGDVVLLIVKILVIIYVIVPLIVIDCCTIIGLVFSVIYWIKGIDLFGLSLLLFGISSLLTYIIKIIFSLLFGKSKPHLSPVIVSVIMIAAGTFMFIDMIMGIEYYDELPNDIKLETESKEFNTDKPVYLEAHGYSDDKITRTINKDLKDGQFIIEVSYFKDNQNIEFRQTDNFKFSDHCDYDYDDENYYNYEDEYEDYQHCKDTSLYNYIEIMNNYNGDFSTFKKEYNRFIDNLKDGKVYNYGNMNYHKVEIIANEKTMETIKID